MGGVTPVLDLPYPSPSDPANGAAQMQALAEAIELAVATQASLAAHIDSVANAHPAFAISFEPTELIDADDTQGAIEELQALLEGAIIGAGQVPLGGAAGAVLRKVTGADNDVEWGSGIDVNGAPVMGWDADTNWWVGDSSQLDFADGKRSIPIGLAYSADERKVDVRGAIKGLEVDDPFEFIMRRVPGDYETDTIAETTLAVAIPDITAAATIVCADLHDGTDAWTNTGIVYLQRTAAGSEVAVLSYTTIDRATGTLGGLTLIHQTRLDWAAAGATTVTRAVLEGTTIGILHGQTWMGKGGFQDRSQQLGAIADEDHYPDGNGGYFAAGRWDVYVTLPGPDSLRLRVGSFLSNGNLAITGLPGGEDLTPNVQKRRITVAQRTCRIAEAVTLPAATIYVDNPFGMPTSGTLQIASTTGDQEVTFTGWSADLATGRWRFTGCAGGTGDVVQGAKVYMHRKNIGVVIGGYGNIAAHDFDSGTGQVEIGAVGPTAASPEAGIVFDRGAGAITAYKAATGTIALPAIRATGITGAVDTPITLAGGKTNGAPTAGTFPKGAVVVDDTGAMFYCTVAGTPGTWVRVNGLDRLWIGASAFVASSGAPTLSTIGGSRIPAWLLDAAADEQVSASWAVPDSWLTMAVDLHWSNAGAGAGDVNWRCEGSATAAAATYAADVFSNSAAAVAAPAQNIKAVFSSLIANASLAVARSGHLHVQRRGSLGTDTLGNDAAVVGVLLRRLT